MLQPRHHPSFAPAFTSTGRCFVGWLLAVVLLGVNLLAASPTAHAALHADAGHADHSCAITMAQQGFCDTAAPPPLVALLGLTPSEVPWRAPDFEKPAQPRYRHMPALAPPEA